MTSPTSPTSPFDSSGEVGKLESFSKADDFHFMESVKRGRRVPMVPPHAKNLDL